MKLNYSDRCNLRDYLLNVLEDVPEGERVSLPNDLLDQLIFERAKGYDGLLYKVPVWTGSFLKKLDLSNISFEKVLWNRTSECLDELFSSDVQRRLELSYNIHDYRSCLYDIDFSGTNVRINSFSNLSTCGMRNCNLEGVDLSNNKFNVDCYNDFNAFNVNFCNTGCKFIVLNELENKSNFKTLLEDDNLAGCYINNVYIKSNETKEISRNALKQKYDSYVSTYYSAIDKIGISYGSKSKKK